MSTNNIKVTVGTSAIRDHWIVKGRPVCRSTAPIVARCEVAIKAARFCITCKKCNSGLLAHFAKSQP